jgi:hypothetical protein
MPQETGLIDICLISKEVTGDISIYQAGMGCANYL